MNLKLKLIATAIMVVGAISSAHAQTIPSSAQADLLRLYREQFMPRGNAVVQVTQTPFDPQADLLRLYQEQFMPRGSANSPTNEAQTELNRSLGLKPLK
jgi:hypothetical protein